MDIPSEAWRAAEKADRVASESVRVTAIVGAAAPHIARAAQVEVLNRLDAIAEEWSCDSTGRSAARLRAELGLEAA